MGDLESDWKMNQAHFFFLGIIRLKVILVFWSASLSKKGTYTLSPTIMEVENEQFRDKPVIFQGPVFHFHDGLPTERNFPKNIPQPIESEDLVVAATTKTQPSQAAHLVPEKD